MYSITTAGGNDRKLLEFKVHQKTASSASCAACLLKFREYSDLEQKYLFSS